MKTLPKKHAPKPASALTTEQQRIIALEERLEYLEAENAYLKKLDALLRAKTQAAHTKLASKKKRG